VYPMVIILNLPIKVGKSIKMSKVDVNIKIGEDACKTVDYRSLQFSGLPDTYYLRRN